jgi:hypothetical protein
MNIGWRTKYILALSEDFLIHRWKLSGTMGLAHGFHLSKTKKIPINACIMRFMGISRFKTVRQSRQYSLILVSQSWVEESKQHADKGNDYQYQHHFDW